jgi:transposase-like protein
MPDLVTLTNLLDDAKCYEVVRQLRGPDGVACPKCRGMGVVRNGLDDRTQNRQRYLCQTCRYRFDDLTGTVLSGHHQPVSTWLLCSYFMGLNLSNRQIAHELGLCESDVQAMTEALRQGIVAKTPEVVLSGDVEVDEVDIVAGHKGQREAVRAKGRHSRRNKLKGIRGRGTLDKEKPPVFGMIERDGPVVIQMLPNVQQETIHPIIEKTVAKGSTVYTDEYTIYTKLPGLGYEHKTVCHGCGEYARDEDGDGFCEVHVNTMEGFWSLLRSWLRPHRGISQEKLPAYLGFFQFIHNARKRGKALLSSLIEALVT